MKKNFLFQLLLAAFLLPAFSCSDDDSAPEINNATTLNMLDVENGATRLGNSDIYINAANNFQTNECLIAEIGPSKGIGKVIPPQVGNGLVYQAAVTPGHLYQAFKEEAVKQFPSGKFALALAGDYYQFYVGSEIMKEEKRVGAVIQFALINPEADGLPAYDSTIGTVVSGYEDEIVREFPKDTEFSYDSDLEDHSLYSIDKFHPNPLSDRLSEKHRDSHDPDIGAEKTERHGDKIAYTGKENEKAHPGTFPFYPILHFLQFDGIQFQIFLYPFDLAQHTQPITTHAT